MPSMPIPAVSSTPSGMARTSRRARASATMGAVSGWRLWWAKRRWYERNRRFRRRLRINRPAGSKRRVYARLYYTRNGRTHRKTVSGRYTVCP